MHSPSTRRRTCISHMCVCLICRCLSVCPGVGCVDVQNSQVLAIHERRKNVMVRYVYCVCVSLCLCVCVYLVRVCFWVCEFVGKCVGVCVYMCACVFVCERVCVWVCVCLSNDATCQIGVSVLRESLIICLQKLYMCICVWVCLSVQKKEFLHILLYIYEYMCVFVCEDVFLCFTCSLNYIPKTIVRSLWVCVCIFAKVFCL